MPLIEYMTEEESQLFDLALEASEDALYTMNKLIDRAKERRDEESLEGRT